MRTSQHAESILVGVLIGLTIVAVVFWLT